MRVKPFPTLRSCPEGVAAPRGSCSICRSPPQDWSRILKGTENSGTENKGKQELQGWITHEKPTPREQQRSFSNQNVSEFKRSRRRRAKFNLILFLPKKNSLSISGGSSAFGSSKRKFPQTLHPLWGNKTLLKKCPNNPQRQHQNPQQPKTTGASVH